MYVRRKERFMKKTAIVYASTHHGNTKKLLDAIAAKYDVALIDVSEFDKKPLGGYQLIGFASGVYYGAMDKKVLAFAENNLPKHKKVFLIETFGARPSDKKITAIVRSKECEIVGRYGCRGFDTYGPLKAIGGVSKGHPTAEEISGAVAFFGGLAES